MKRMQQQLRAMIRTIHESSESIVSALSEIATGNQDLSQRTEEQAASLEETVASIEQLAGTLSQTADNAKIASSLATDASALANQGGELTGEVADAMNGIVGDSRRIGEIVKGDRAITADTDLRLARFFGLSDGYWLRARAAHDAEVAFMRISGHTSDPADPGISPGRS